MFSEKNLTFWGYGYDLVFNSIIKIVCLMTKSIDFPFILCVVIFLWYQNFFSELDCTDFNLFCVFKKLKYLQLIQLNN